MLNEYEEIPDFQHLISSYIPTYNASFHQNSLFPHKNSLSNSMNNTLKNDSLKNSLKNSLRNSLKNSSKKSSRKASKKSLDQRHFKVTFEKPTHRIMGDCDTLLANSNISDIHLKSSGILAQKTLFKSKCLAFSHINNRLSEVEFCDVESQINNTNSIYLENAFNEINTISSILIRNNKESSDFPRKHFNIKRKIYKIAGKELLCLMNSKE